MKGVFVGSAVAVILVIAAIAALILVSGLALALLVWALTGVWLSLTAGLAGGAGIALLVALFSQASSK